MLILAESTPQAANYYPEIIGGLVTTGTAVSGFILWYCKRSILKETQERQQLVKRVEKLETITNNNYGFISGVTAAAQGGPHVPSALILDLHDQHKPSDSSGVFKPIPRKHL